MQDPKSKVSSGDLSVGSYNSIESLNLLSMEIDGPPRVKANQRELLRRRTTKEEHVAMLPREAMQSSKDH